jgi:hypothetical protein
MIDTILLEMMLFPIKVRLAVKQLLANRLERIAVLYQRSQVSDTKAAMPAIHSRALESLKSSINQDKALIAQRRGEPAPEARTPTTLDEESQSIRSGANQATQSPKSIKPRPTRDKQKSRRRTYMK